MTTSLRLSLLSCCLSLSGCDAVMPPVISEAELVRMGVNVAYHVATGDAQAVPTPGGGLKVGDACPDCGGRGSTGDGTIESTCGRCRGTGRILPTDPCVSQGVEGWQEWDPNDITPLDCTQESETPPELEDGVLYKIDGRLYQREWRDGRYHYVPAVLAR